MIIDIPSYVRESLLYPDQLDTSKVVQIGYYFYIPGGAVNKYGRLTFGFCDCNRGLDSKGACPHCDR